MKFSQFWILYRLRMRRVSKKILIKWCSFLTKDLTDVNITGVDLWCCQQGGQDDRFLDLSISILYLNLSDEAGHLHTFVCPCCFLTSFITKVCAPKGPQIKTWCSFCQIFSPLCTKSMKALQVSESISELLDLVCLSALNLYSHLTHSQGCLRQQWGLRCERRGQHWHLTPFHFLDSDVPFILKCQQVLAVLMGVNSGFSQTGVIFVCFFCTEVSDWATHTCQMPLNLFHVVFNLLVTFL